MPIDWSSFKRVDPKYLPKDPNAPPPTRLPTVITKYGPMVIRGAGGLLAGEGGPTGGFISGASELGAQALEGRRNPASVAGAAAIGAIPFGRTATLARAALKGGALSGGATALNQQTEQGLHLPSGAEARDIGIATGIGGITAGGLHALAGGAGKKIPLNEKKLLGSGRERLQLRDFNPTEPPTVGTGPFHSGSRTEIKLAGKGETPAARASSPNRVSAHLRNFLGDHHPTEGTSIIGTPVVETKPVNGKAKVTIGQEPTVPIDKNTAPIVKTPKQLEDERILKEVRDKVVADYEAGKNKTTKGKAKSKVTVKAEPPVEGVDPAISKLVGGKGKKNSPRNPAPRMASSEGLANDTPGLWDTMPKNAQRVFSKAALSPADVNKMDPEDVDTIYMHLLGWTDNESNFAGVPKITKAKVRETFKKYGLPYLDELPPTDLGKGGIQLDTNDPAHMEVLKQHLDDAINEKTIPIGNDQEAMFHSEQPTVELPHERSTANDMGEPPIAESVNPNSGSMPNVAPPTANEPPIVNIDTEKARSYQPPRLPKPSEVNMNVKDLGGTRQGGGFIPPPSQPPAPEATGFLNSVKRLIPRDKQTGRVDYSEMINLPKAFKASFDLSPALRQGIVLMRRKAWRDSIVPMIRSLKNKNYEEEMARIRSHPRYKDAKAQGIRISHAGDEAGVAGEEAFGSKIARKVPILGKYVVAPSERAYTTFLDSLRIKTYDEMMTQAEKMQARDPKGFGEIPKQNIANYINTASGRGSLAPTITSPSKTGEKAAEALNLGLFSPRFIASRMQLLNPYTYYKLDPFTRSEALKDVRAMAGMVGSALVLAKATGAGDVTLDPRDPDWGKIKSGNTRVDLTGGFGPYIRFFAQAMNGVSTGTDGPDIARFVKSKESPTVGIASEAIEGKDFFGKEQARWKPVAKTVVPLIMEDWYSLLQSDPGLLTGGGAGAAALFGLPVQTYDSSGRKSGSSKGSGSSARSTRTRYKP